MREQGATSPHGSRPCASRPATSGSAIVLAVLSSIANLVFMAAYHLWSLIMITVNVLVIYAVTAHGDRRSLDGY